MKTAKNAGRSGAARSARAAAREPGVSQRNLAYESFRQQILSARIRPGQFVSQRELMRLLDMPLGAVREMIPRLEAARLIVTVPKRGLQIAPVDLKLIRNAFQVRAMIEREAVLNFVRHASDEELTRIEQQHRDILARATSGKPDSRLDDDAQAADWGLHDTMIDAMGNEILSEIYRVNSLHVRLIRLDADQVRPMRVVPAMQEHLKFIDALRARDERRAVDAVAEHIENSRERVITAMLGGGAPAREARSSS
ncbi:MAG: GntR family transcriptional regulator [Betaproteobacteria bacterium]|nr:MAG: GntR family transcriptional regulator [Betaproteobacteria bacterium]